MSLVDIAFFADIVRHHRHHPMVKLETFVVHHRDDGDDVLWKAKRWDIEKKVTALREMQSRMEGEHFSGFRGASYSSESSLEGCFFEYEAL
jgi:hypothetical protein